MSSFILTRNNFKDFKDWFFKDINLNVHASDFYGKSAQKSGYKFAIKLL
jgi:hypothetical protein